MSFCFDGDDQLNSVGGRFGGVDSMEMEESVEGIGCVVESRPLLDPFPTFIVIRALDLLLIALLFCLEPGPRRNT